MGGGGEILTATKDSRRGLSAGKRSVLQIDGNRTLQGPDADSEKR